MKTFLAATAAVALFAATGASAQFAPAPVATPAADSLQPKMTSAVATTTVTK